MSVNMAAYVYALTIAGHSMNFQPEQKYSKRTNLPAGRQIVEILIHSPIDNFLPGTKAQ
jgi:hypothetical protein